MRIHPPGLTGPGERRAALLLVTVASVNASYTVLIPLVPELRHRAGAGPAVIALTFALFAGAKAAVQPVAGRWVDRWRPGPVACVSLMVAAVGIAVTAAGDGDEVLFAWRSLEAYPLLIWATGATPVQIPLRDEQECRDEAGKLVRRFLVEEG